MHRRYSPRSKVESPKLARAQPPGLVGAFYGNPTDHRAITWLPHALPVLLLKACQIEPSRIRNLKAELPKARAEYEKAKAAGKQPIGQVRAAGLPFAASRMPATMLFGTGSKRNGSIEYAARPFDSERIAVA